MTFPHLKSFGCNLSAVAVNLSFLWVGNMLLVLMCYTCQPAGVPESHNWLNLPDEVWLSILSVLPHGDLSRVVEVCHRLHTLATDHTLCTSFFTAPCYQK